jgi:hypothetical protein
VPYAAEFVRDYGCLYMKKYDLAGGPALDLRTHSWARSKEWGYSGVPDYLEPEAKLHGIRSYVSVVGWDQVCDALSNGWPVIVGSGFGFKGQRNRDDEGFLKPNGTWMHAMVWTGYDDTGRRPGALTENSWGDDWVGGPKRHDQPDGSFWTEADVVDSMTRKGEAIAVCQHEGFAAPEVEYTLL